MTRLKIPTVSRYDVSVIRRGKVWGKGVWNAEVLPFKQRAKSDSFPVFGSVTSPNN